ncbi:MAG TPA: hypothetical protein VN418_01045 [Gammaproteobacteria bacterium]|nr:hypothetical protein [Gammaproteobacteria bacterium]
MQRDQLFGLTFENIPLINLRRDFNQTYSFVFHPDFARVFESPIRPVELPLMVWKGMPDDLVTVLLQRAVLGVESYLPGALFHTAGHLGKVSSELFAKLRNPFSFGSKSAVVNIYHRMPAELHWELSLLHFDAELFEKTKLFYQHIRNPLFHGKQLSRPEVQSVRAAMDHLARLYEWIDHWFNPEHLIPGGTSLAGIRSKDPPSQNGLTAS